MKHIASDLTQVKADLLQRMPEEEAMAAAWRLVCGEAVADKTRFLGCAHRVLTIEVADPAWRTQLTELAASYVKDLNRLLPGKIERVRFLAASPEESARR